MVPVVVAPERHHGGLDRYARRDARDAEKLRNAGRFAFRHFWGQMEMADVELSYCTGTLKRLDEDIKNVIRKIDSFTEETGEAMEYMVFDGYDVVLADQCVVWRQMIYRRQNYLFTKEKVDAAEEICLEMLHS